MLDALFVIPIAKLVLKVRVRGSRVVPANCGALLHLGERPGENVFEQGGVGLPKIPNHVAGEIL